MIYKYKYNLKVYECSIPNCDDYTLQYYYFYILCSKDPINLITDEDYVTESLFEYKDKYYLIFWVKKNKKFIYTKEKIKINIAYYLIKTEDSYVIRKNTNKIFNEIVKQQYSDLSYNKYNITNILSTVWFNIITSNKILYHEFFIKEKIIKNTYITTVNNISNINLNKFIIKTPYSSASHCVSILKRDLPKDCYKDEGIIIQKINKSLKDIELKLHVFNGKIMYGNIKNYNKDTDTLNEDLNIISNNNQRLQKIIIKHKKEIIQLCRTIFFKMNEFIFAIKYKLLQEYKNFIVPLKLDKEIFMSLFKQKKLKILKQKRKEDTNNKELIEKYIKFINVEPSLIIKNISPITNIMDLYMRIDLMMPDYKNYKTVSLLEIEPFACGKGFINNIKDGIDINKSIYIRENISSNSIVFTKYFQELIKTKYIDKVKFTSIK